MLSGERTDVLWFGVDGDGIANEVLAEEEGESKAKLLDEVLGVSGAGGNDSSDFTTCENTIICESPNCSVTLNGCEQTTLTRFHF